MLVDTLFYLFELNLILADTQEVLGLALQAKSLALVLTSIVMARYLVSYRILRYWGHIVAYRYCDNYPKNEIDIVHNSNQKLNAVGDVDKGSLVEHQYTRR